MTVRSQRLPWKPSLFLMEKVRPSLKKTTIITIKATSSSLFPRIYGSNAFFIPQSRKASESHKLSKFHSALGTSGIFPNPFTSSPLPWNPTITPVDQIPGVTLEKKVSWQEECALSQKWQLPLDYPYPLTLSTLVIPMLGVS